MPHFLLIQSSADGHLGFHHLTIMNVAGMGVGVRTSVWVPCLKFLWTYTLKGNCRITWWLYACFCGTTVVFSVVTAPLYVPTSGARRVQFFHVLPMLIGWGFLCLFCLIKIRAWWAAVHGVAKSRTRLSDFTFTFLFHALEKEMATHSGVPAWRIPGTVEPGGLPSMGSHRVGHDWSDLT